MLLLSVLPVSLLVLVLGWFVWPLVADPIARRLSSNTSSQKKANAEDFFDTWQKHGLGSPISPQARRG